VNLKYTQNGEHTCIHKFKILWCVMSSEISHHCTKPGFTSRKVGAATFSFCLPGLLWHRRPGKENLKVASLVNYIATKTCWLLQQMSSQWYMTVWHKQKWTVQDNKTTKQPKHTERHPFNGLFSSTILISQKIKPRWIWMKQEMTG